MKKYSVCRRVAALLTALILLAYAGAVNAHALYGSPSNPVWSDGVGMWNAPDASEGEVSYYHLTLYKNHKYVDDYTAYYTSYNFSGAMEYSGKGWYTFSVSAVYTDDTMSPSVSSSIYKYGYEEKHTHTMEFHSFTYPTCTEKGCKGYYVCTDCGKWYWDNNGEYEITDHDEAFTEPLGHDWGEWKIVKQATTTEEGKAQRVCKNDENHVESYTIPKLKSKEEKPTLPKETEKETEKATEAETKAEETKATEKATETTAPTVIATENTGDKGIFGDNTTLIILIAVGVLVLIVIPVVVILIVTSLNKKKKNNQPPTNTPPTNTPPTGGNMPPQYMPPNGGNGGYVPPTGGYMPPANTPPANTPPANTPPANYPPTNYPPTNTPPTNTPPTNTPPTDTP